MVDRDPPGGVAVGPLGIAGSGQLVLAGLWPMAWAAMVAGVLGKASFQAVER